MSLHELSSNRRIVSFSARIRASPAPQNYLALLDMRHIVPSWFPEASKYLLKYYSRRLVMFLKKH